MIETVVIETPQLEEAVELHEVPKLLVDWSSPWQEFKTAIVPALARSEARLAGEAPYGMFPFRGMVPTMLLEAFLIFAAIVIRVKIEELRPYVAPRLSSHDVIYYSGDELPRTEDLGGAQAGTSGRAGGQEAHHRTQTIRIARGGSLTPRVVDAPNLKLPASRDAVANLLAIKPDPGPPPSQGLRSTRTALTFPVTAVAPPPNAVRDYTRSGVKLDAVIPPSPVTPRDPFRSAPNLSASVIPPAPKVSNDHTLVAPALSTAVIPPAPNVSRDRTLTAPSLAETVVAPAPSATRDKGRAAPALNASVIPPAPNNVSREVTRSPVQMANAAVVPPPVSAPERASTRNSALTMPAPTVIAPPPSADAAQDIRRLAGGSAADPSKAIVPPPPSQSSGGSFMSSLIGKIFGPNEVVPPPPAVTSSDTRGGAAAAAATNVVPPPPSVGGGNPRGLRNGSGASLGAKVIAPPPSDGMAGGTGTRPVGASAAPTLGPPGVVPPPPSLSGPGGGAGDTGGGNGAPGGTLLANNVIPPPPSLGGGSSASGSGLGHKGSGVGGPMDIGSAVAPPSASGSGTNTGAVISSQPGPKVGLPSVGGKGSLAMSPAGGDKPGLGGSGGGSSIGRGNGPGSGMNGNGTGAGKSGTGVGSDPNARGGISPSPGPGGAGSATSGTPPVPGVAVSGGSTIVTLPSFGSDPAANDPSAPGRSSLKQRQTLGVDVVATAGSGGAFESYRKLFHTLTHTTYVETSLGQVVMEYADESSAGQPYTGAITPPQQVRADLPDGLPRARMVVTCTLDATGNLKNMRVLEPGPAAMTAKVMAALKNWKFQPALRSGQPVEVTAILGFGISTDDRL